LLGAVVIAVALATVVPLLIPVAPLPGLVPPQELADPDSRFVGIGGLEVHYKMAGEGEPVFLLLHGFAASTFSWREVMGPLGEMGTAIAYDRPGFGLTERPLPGEWSGPSPYSPQAQVGLALGLMDALGVSRAVLVGNSAGGALAVQVALAFPQRVQALVLVSPAIYSRGGLPPFLWPLLSTPQAQKLGPLLARSFATSGQRLAELAWHDPGKLTEQIWEGYRKPLRAQNWDRALWEVMRAGPMPPLAQRLGELQVPVLVITGDDDRVVPVEQTARAAREIPGARLVLLPACGHVPQEECPEAFLEALKDFVSSLPGGAG
jgi:pimeloyl-ACP methyl ester carboxylesterase